MENSRKVALFITKFYKRKDFRLKDLDLKFIQDLEYFFKSRIKNLLKSRKLLKQKFVSHNLLNPKEITVNSKDHIFLERLYLVLEKNLETNNVKAPEIAKQLHMSHSKMYKKINL